MNLLKSAKFWMVSIGVLLIVIAGVILLVIFIPRNEQHVLQQHVPVTDPFGSLGSGGVSSGNTLPLTLRDGSEVLVPDFTTAEQPVWVSRYEYQVTGSPM